MAKLTLAGFDTALAMEWAVISTGLRARRSLAAWTAREPCLAGFESPRELVEAIVDGPVGESIELSQAVLRLAADDPLAARVLIQVMMPTLATECFRTARVLWRARVPVDDGDVVALVLGAAAEAVGSYARLVVPFPLRTLRRRTIEIVTRRRARMIEDARANPVGLVEDVGLAATEAPRSATEALAETLATAVELGVVSSDDANLVWVSRAGGFTTLALAEGEERESERLRRRRSRAQRRLIEHRERLLEAGVAV